MNDGNNYEQIFYLLKITLDAIVRRITHETLRAKNNQVGHVVNPTTQD